jgi:hypothetical protein
MFSNATFRALSEYGVCFDFASRFVSQTNSFNQTTVENIWLFGYFRTFYTPVSVQLPSKSVFLFITMMSSQS